eukprot:364555-Chlamydomonas_euryale.AAC.13
MLACRATVWCTLPVLLPGSLAIFNGITLAQQCGQCCFYASISVPRHSSSECCDLTAAQGSPKALSCAYVGEARTAKPCCSTLCIKCIAWHACMPCFLLCLLACLAILGPAHAGHLHALAAYKEDMHTASCRAVGWR